MAMAEKCCTTGPSSNSVRDLPNRPAVVEGRRLSHRAMATVPILHVSGLVCIALSVVTAGGCTLVMRQSFEKRNEAFRKLASLEQMAFWTLALSIYTLIAMTPELDGTDVSNWRIGCFGGAPIPVDTTEHIG